MAGMLDRLNGALEEKLTVPGAEKVGKKEEKLAFYKKVMSDRKTVEIKFTGADVSDENEQGGMFTKYEDGVLLVLPFSNMAEPEINKYRAAGLLNVTFRLHVESIDEAEGKVVLRFTNERERRQTVRMACINEINNRIEKKEYPRVRGRITRVDPFGAMVDILDQGIIGRIPATRWQPCFTRTLLGKCKVGEYYEFVIVSRMERRSDTPARPTYNLSRLDIAENPWDKVNSLGIKTGSAVLVTCYDKPDGKTFWWGSSERVPGIEILGDYTEKFPKSSMFNGITYLCKVRQFNVDKDNPRNNRFSVTPFDVIEEDRAKFSGMVKARRIEVEKEELSKLGE